ncbi:3-ketoacyl-CoA synthase 6-like [Apium graveolens]|uniref:3-ketoacyl-CoA synthase 6-like n=1 Tax=Apium graveolens TaxID=4045 RepID=UPI003D7C0D07
MLITIMFTVFIEVLRFGPHEILSIWNSLHIDLIKIQCSFFVVIFISTIYCMSKPRRVYLVDVACFKQPKSCRLSSAAFIEHSKINMSLDPKTLNFLLRVLERSGLGEETYLPEALHYMPPKITLKTTRDEAEMVIFSAMDSLFEKTGIDPKHIDVLVVNCSSCVLTPTLTDMAINKYKMRGDIKSFNLSGMGCSASVIALDLVRHLFQAHANCNAVIVSAEILTPNYYGGKVKAMLVPYCLFRMGSTAILLSNRKSFRHRAKYSLLHIVRTHKGADDRAYGCAFQEEDIEGKLGVMLSKELMTIAGEALKSNMTTLGPLVLPASEQLLFGINFIGRKIFNLRWKPYIPDFKLAFEHFCIHAGGRAVIDELQNGLQLSTENVEASRMTLHRFGNISSSSLWYELSYIESKGRMKKGDRVWQIGFGSGFKCNSAVWRCNRTIKTPIDGPWLDCIHRYPVDVPQEVKLG